jgi:dephospho-CoA kinase
MLTLRKIAVTGAISSGKSTVCQYLKELGAYVVSADQIVHQLLSPHSLSGQKVIELLGQDVIQQNKIDKQKIAALVFDNPRLLMQLEAILHPAVASELEKEYHKAAAAKKYSSFVAEVPLLYESGMEDFFDRVIVVSAPKDACMRRWVASGKTPEEYEKRMQRQLSAEKKASFTSYHLTNQGDLKQLQTETAKLYQQLI